MSSPSRFVRTVALLCLAIAALPLRAQTKDAQDEGPVRRWGADAKAYVTTPLHAERKQWVKFGSTVAAIAFAYQHDDDVRAHFVPEGTPTSTTHDSHSAQDALCELCVVEIGVPSGTKCARMSSSCWYANAIAATVLPNFTHCLRSACSGAVT